MVLIGGKPFHPIIANVLHKRGDHPSEGITWRVFTRFYKQSFITNPLFIKCLQIQKEG
jgi:hypothetical protein